MLDPVLKPALLLPAWLLILIFLSATGPVWAADPLRLQVEGVAGEVLANVQAALAFPPGLVRDGNVDRRWLERFERQVPDRARRALEPFGFYAASIRTEATTVDGGAKLLKVVIEPGKPVRLTQVEVVVEGPGAEREALKQLRDNFPLRVGQVLQQEQYQQAKKELKSQAVALGYLDAVYLVHEIRVDPPAMQRR